MVDMLQRDMSGDFPPGTWRLCRRNGGYGANFACPKCGARGGLGFGTNHRIAGRAADGVVNPSVVCDTPECGYHEHIVLVGWSNALATAGRSP